VLIFYFGICKSTNYFQTVKKSLANKKQKVFLELLYQVRTTSGLRQIDLANKLNVNQSFISKIESGERRIDIIELIEICECLEVNILDFVKKLDQKLNESK